jgi:hypothetical protein
MPSDVRDQMSGIRCQGSDVRRQMSGDRCQETEEVTGGFATVGMLGRVVLPPSPALRAANFL